MRMYDLIIKKRNGEILSKEEISFIVDGFTKGSIPDYQMSALLMAIFFQGLNEEETLNLTLAMAHSGDMLDLSKIHGIKADKHSTGGVGDKTSLVLGPMVAACGVPVAKMSGRGLGHTGGTIDKLESFTGFSTSISEDEFIHNVNTLGISIVGQTANLAPADKKIYALRDVTATVDNMSLIASSIMSKKLASGAQVLVLDIKTGDGAFMKTEEDSIALAKAMTAIGNSAGRDVWAVISDMSQPLGNTVGNALEIEEVIDTLQGDGPEDLLELCLELGGYMLLGTGKASTIEDAKQKLRKTISSGAALDKFAHFIEAQGGDKNQVYHPQLLPKASITYDCKSAVSGYVASIRTEEIGMISLVLGGGRETKESSIDLAVGLRLHKKIGDYVEAGETLVTLYANEKQRLKDAINRFDGIYTITNEPAEPPKLIRKIVK